MAKALGIPKPGSVPLSRKVTDWRYASGAQADGGAVSKFLDGLLAAAEHRMPERLYDVLGEALTNVRHHAYPKDQRWPAELCRWWLFGSHVPPNGDQPAELFIAAYDMGVGIPHTMKRRLKTGEIVLNIVDGARRIMASATGPLLDAKLLEHAVERTRSSTGDKFRGLGLPEMRTFASSTPHGNLHIVSGHSWYTYPGKHPDGHPGGVAHPTPSPFPGTLILWRIPLPATEATA